MHALLLLALAAAPASNTRSWEFHTGGSPEVRVSAINGSIRVEASDDDRVQVEADQEGAGTDPRLRVEARQEGDAVEVKVCCGPCGEARQSCPGHTPRVRLSLRVPRRSELDLSAVNADVRVQGVAGPQEVSIVNGKVEVSGSADDVSVSTVNGAVELAPRRLGDTEVSTVAGPVRLKLPERAGARVSFSSVGGRFNGRGVALGSVNETYGDGRSEVAVSTVSGTLDVEAR